MGPDHRNNQSKINQVLYLVKFATLFFPAMSFFQYYFGEHLQYNAYFFVEFILVILAILLLYVLWDFLWKKQLKYRYIFEWIQSFVFIAYTTIGILLTGSYESNYKFLFFFIIISSTIESGFKIGMSTACICSSIILGFDLFLAPNGFTGVNTYFASDLILAGAFLIFTYTIATYVETEREHISELNEKANVDGLTGLYNHRYFYDSITNIIEDSDKNKKPVSLFFIDIDYFKYYNDLHGHQKGDEVLKKIGCVIKSTVRKGDIAARYGGEEFAVILPNTTEAEAIKIAEQLRFTIEETKFYGEEYQPNENLTISLGVSVYPSKAKSEIELIKHADEALYRAKFLRKNRVEGYSSIFEDLQFDLNSSDQEVITSIKTLIAVINAREKYTFGHVERVVSYCKLFAEKLNLSFTQKRDLIYGAYMHDIGKINIAKEILVKSTPLTPEEWEKIKGHPQNAVDIIKNVSALKDVVPIILQHHERIDGSGYPNNLKGDNINYLARVLTVVDSFDAMTSERPYHKRKTYAEGAKELLMCSGTQFDEDLAQKFIEVIKENVGSRVFYE